MIPSGKSGEEWRAGNVTSFSPHGRVTSAWGKGASDACGGAPDRNGIVDVMTVVFSRCGDSLLGTCGGRDDVCAPLGVTVVSIAVMSAAACGGCDVVSRPTSCAGDTVVPVVAVWVRSASSSRDFSRTSCLSSAICALFWMSAPMTTPAAVMSAAMTTRLSLSCTTCGILRLVMLSRTGRVHANCASRPFG